MIQREREWFRHEATVYVPPRASNICAALRLIIRHTENVVFTNVTHDVSPKDAREAIVLEDVTGFETVD